MKKLLPIILLLLGGGGGVGAGYFLRPPPPEPEMVEMVECDQDDETCESNSPMGEGNSDMAEGEAVAEQTDEALPEANGAPEYVALQRQMIVPIVSEDQVISLVVMSLSIEVQAGFSLEVYDREPKLRDAFLQVLFRHANTGGFSGAFTSGEKMSDLRRALNGAAQQVLGPMAIQVLVTDILRQET